MLWIVTTMSIVSDPLSTLSFHHLRLLSASVQPNKTIGTSKIHLLTSQSSIVCGLRVGTHQEKKRRENKRNLATKKKQCDNYGKLVNHAKYKKNTLISTNWCFSLAFIFRYHM